MTLSLPRILTAGSIENINDVQANFSAIANTFPLETSGANFQPVPQCYVYSAVAQSIPNLAITALTFDSELFDIGTATNNMHDVATPSNVTCRIAGLYHIVATASFTANATNTREIFIWVNGNPVTGTQVPAAPASGVTHINVAIDSVLAVGDIVTAQVVQESGGALNTSVSGLLAPSLMMYWVSP